MDAELIQQLRLNVDRAVSDLLSSGSVATATTSSSSSNFVNALRLFPSNPPRRRATKRTGKGRHPGSFTVPVKVIEPHTTVLDLNQISKKRQLGESCQFSETKKLKLSLSCSAQELRQSIQSAFPQLLGNFELMRCTSDRKLIVLPADVDCPAKLKEYPLFKRSAIYVRPMTFDDISQPPSGPTSAAEPDHPTVDAQSSNGSSLRVQSIIRRIRSNSRPDQGKQSRSGVVHALRKMNIEEIPNEDEPQAQLITSPQAITERRSSEIITRGLATRRGVVAPSGRARNRRLNLFQPSADQSLNNHSNYGSNSLELPDLDDTLDILTALQTENENQNSHEVGLSRSSPTQATLCSCGRTLEVTLDRPTGVCIRCVQDNEFATSLSADRLRNRQIAETYATEQTSPEYSSLPNQPPTVDSRSRHFVTAGTPTVSFAVASDTLSVNDDDSDLPLDAAEIRSRRLSHLSRIGREDSISNIPVELIPQQTTLTTVNMGSPESGRNWKDDLLSLQSALAESEGVNVVNVARDHVLECFVRAVSRKSFSPGRKFDICFVDNGDTSEGSIDSGGPTREFFRLLLSEIADTSIFQTLDGGKQMDLSTCALEKKAYYNAGLALSLSPINGGPSPAIFSPLFYDLLVEKVEVITIDDVGCGDVKKAMRKIQEAKTMEEVSDAVEASSDMLCLFGSLRPISSLLDRDEFVRTFLRYYMVTRLQPAFSQFRQGLQDGGLWNCIINDEAGSRSLFVESGVCLTAKILADLFSASMSPVGHSLRSRESVTLSFWRDWLLNVEEGDQPCSLPQILIFVSGADRVPPLGFPGHPSIVFNHDVLPVGTRKFPTANTCSIELRLPVLHDFDEFCRVMSDGIIQATEFGFH